MTSLEVSNLGRFGYMGGRGGSSYASQMGIRHQHQQTLSPPDEETPTLGAHGHVHGHGARTGGGGGGMCAGCGSGFLMNLLGFDRFTRGGAANGLARAGKAANPFDLGVVGNCRDFWTRGRELGVEYDRLYAVPPEGFREAKRRREMEEGMEDSGSGSGSGAGSGAGRKGLRQTLMMGLGIGGRGGRTGGYEPVSQA
ncbi:hypothetical protein OF83DRAFT_364616 [Amylostereum chailletii]|nr:hypothetical protein OF83DRAFT_364616 [Amylostereum chailletii]